MHPNETKHLPSKLYFSEVVAMKAACGPAHMKSILAIGELGSMNNVYKVSDGGCSYMISALFPALVSLINKKVSVRRPY